MTNNASASTINALPERRVPAAGERGPTPLTDADLDRVAAAGAKPGQSGGISRNDHPAPLR